MPQHRAVSGRGGNLVVVPRAYQHPLLRALHAALLEEAEVEIDRKLRVAVLMAAGHHQTEVAARLGIPVSDVRLAVRQLERVAPHLEVAPGVDAD